MRTTTSLSFLVPVAAAVAAAACEIVDPELPPGLDDRLVLVAALNPDSARHPVMVWPAQLSDTVRGAVARIHRAKDGSNGGEWTLVAETKDIEDFDVCRRSYGYSRGPEGQCLVPVAALEDGVAYKVEVLAEEHDTAWGATAAVGDFTVDAAELSRGEGDTLSAEWTRSAAAHRYMVSLRLLKSGNVVASYADGWYVAVDGTSVTAPVPEEAIEKAITPFTLDVTAMDVHLYSHIASGNAGSAFSVFPVQNVVGGFGVVGSARYRSLAVRVK